MQKWNRTLFQGLECIYFVYSFVNAKTSKDVFCWCSLEDVFFKWFPESNMAKIARSSIALAYHLSICVGDWSVSMVPEKYDAFYMGCMEARSLKGQSHITFEFLDSQVGSSDFRNIRLLCFFSMFLNNAENRYWSLNSGLTWALST